MRPLPDLLECAGCGDAWPRDATTCATCGRTLLLHKPEPPPKPERAHGRLSGRQRDKYGATVTFTTDEGPLTLHAPGRVGVVLRDLCTQAERLATNPRVVCISTPETVLGDLLGRTWQPRPGHTTAGDQLTRSMLARAGLSRYAP